MAEKYSSKDLQKWLFEKALNAASPQARQILIRNDQRGREDALIGHLYFFKYDPKGKAYLPKYDKFPMVFPIEQYQDGFLGLNLHYLDARQRKALLDQLVKFQNNKEYDETTKLLLSYQLLQGSKRLNSLSRPCIKRYLFNHCRSQFIEIYIDEYDKAIQLPVEDWVFNR
jgi:hypothetical protein